MPSLPRHLFLEDGSTFHVTWQCHNRDWLLKSDWAKRLYLDLLLKYKSRYQVQIYSYCLMDNHPHLTGRLKNLGLFSDFFRVVNACFARTYNRAVKRRGQVVMDRFKSPRIQTDRDLLNVMGYIDLNPKRAGKAKRPEDNLFSSFAHYAYGKEDPLITPAPSYLALGRTPEQRQEAYRTIVHQILKYDWKTKQPYSSLPYIGNPDWVKKRIAALRQERRHAVARWRKRFKERFA